MTTTETLTRQRKVEIDTRIAETNSLLYYKEREIAQILDKLHRFIGDERVLCNPNDNPNDPYSAKKWAKTHAATIAIAETLTDDTVIQRVVQTYWTLTDEYSTLLAENAALSEIWQEHQWSRFYYVQNNNGHIHKDTYCSTCYDTTRFAWLTDLSDQTEAEAVESFGKVLCSVCYPSAPTDWTDGEPIEKIKAREEAEVRKAERLAKKLEKALLPDASPLLLYRDNDPRPTKIETLAQAKTWLRKASDYRAEFAAGFWTNYESVDQVLTRCMNYERWTPENEKAVIDAIAAKTETTPEAVAAEFKDKAEKKAKKNRY